MAEWMGKTLMRSEIEMNTNKAYKSSLLMSAIFSFASLLIQPAMAAENCAMIDDTGLAFSTTDGGITLEFGQKFTAGKIDEMHNLFRNPAFKGKAIIDDSQLSFAITPVR
jgi:hypothetical protein